ncbi:MAG: 1,4-dihydroxy-2-naphthoate polyprenyltransferase [Carnobacterium sp.]|jgi:1,4-dihydroxy-2-naphthoate octaprenyltransferase|uniref:1,4-dihydroxy-2-naphthoate polyprenyltransferase n=1 Tax=Carnobacterium TaxID=2747 RepID=UPI00203B7A1A|nr:MULTISPECIES: 1,4-dihydroxy-2-naphthoate polyprenyltransferase [Carnobacterium]MCM3512320.1 1,4-dihydroxy-2-naphthoate polyprenyltransferase [Carnobacterium inhibens]MDN5371806.1 1,4-dihydroxy-2-naphthoate polyprenyltransferase [Carnobacterium sp.]
MSINTFLKLVEIQTKLASLFPFLLGTLFATYYFDSFSPINTLLFFLSMIIFDMTTTAINNLMDYQKAKDEGYKDEVNIIGQEKLSEKLVVRLIVAMLVIAFLLGIILVFRTNIILLLIGAVCFFIGIFYTFGPVPISRMPLGEPISGLTMGFGIFFIAAFVNVEPGTLLSLAFEGTRFIVEGDMVLILSLFLVSLPAVFLIANIMLANNTCDLEQDILNHRYTLPFYIGKKRAVQLFNGLVYSSYAVVVIAIILGLLHPILLLLVVTILPMRKNLAVYNAKQVKSETFVIAIKNIILFCSSEVVLLAISLLFR